MERMKSMVRRDNSWYDGWTGVDFTVNRDNDCMTTGEKMATTPHKGVSPSLQLSVGKEFRDIRRKMFCEYRERYNSLSENDNCSESIPLLERVKKRQSQPPTMRQLINVLLQLCIAQNHRVAQWTLVTIDYPKETRKRKLCGRIISQTVLKAAIIYQKPLSEILGQVFQECPMHPCNRTLNPIVGFFMTMVNNTLHEKG